MTPGFRRGLRSASGLIDVDEKNQACGSCLVFLG
jgi:hypothetical protein